MVHLRACLLKCLTFAFLAVTTQANAADVFTGPAFSADPAALRLAAQSVSAEKHSQATVLLDDNSISFDETGKAVEKRHLIYRVENQDGVENWSEVSGQWEAWHQAKPEIKARVITSDGNVHWLDLKTLDDVPVREDEPGIYTDQRRYGGPLPAVAPGAIIEEEVVTRDTAPLFAAGTAYRWSLAWNVPVSRTRVILSHPASLPLNYEIHLLPEAKVNKSQENGVETITIEHGLIHAYMQQISQVAPDALLWPEIEFSTGTSWQKVATEYARLSDDKLRASGIQAVTAKINVKDGSRSEIIRRIVAALHKNIRYTGVEFGESSLVPQPPSETLKRKYGDCKDKAAFLAAMLRNAGIPANLALLNTGPGRDVNGKLPGMGMFDHAIVYVPASGSDPEVWIDATAQFSQVGTLPWMDYGRQALVVSENAASLRQIPDLTAELNVHREYREFTLVDYGPAQIVETDEEVGPGEADYREYYSGDSKKIRENSEGYVKNMYLADSLTSLDHADLNDLDKPASIKFVTKGKRGSTDLTSAVAAIRLESLFDRLPEYFRTKESSESKEGEAASELPEPRTADWWINPFVTEWRYKFIAPAGFKLRALPSDKDEKIDTLTFTQKYSSNSDGTVVEAVLRVENPNNRLTVQQAKSLRDAVVKASDANPVFVAFDHVGHSLISSGKIKEGLAAYRQLVQQHPKEALHKVQLAQALLDAGLGEQARAIAKDAAKLDPNSALAFTVVGNTLQHDPIGRFRAKGMDYEGAIAAFKKAIALDPKDLQVRTDLATLLEYAPDGTRYAENARLKEAIAAFRELKKIDENSSRKYDDYVLYDLWYTHDYQGVLDFVSALTPNDNRRGLTLASIAVLQGKDAAVKKSLEITTDDHARSAALVVAGFALVRIRRYPEASALLSEGARGQSNETQIMRSAAIFAKTKPYEELKIDSSDPRSVVQELFGQLLSGQATRNGVKSLVYLDPEDSDNELSEDQFQKLGASIKGQLRDFPLVTYADLALSNMHMGVEGDDSLGYRINVEIPGAPARQVYVVRDQGRYKFAAFSSSNSPEDLAWLVLQEVDKNNLVAARKWLDRAREKLSASSGDDPLSGHPFPYFWTKGQDADAFAMRTAALVLLPAKTLKGSRMAALDQARLSARNNLDRGRLTVVLVRAYSAQERWAEMQPLTEELIKSFPTSMLAFNLAAIGYGSLNRFDDWEKLVKVRLQEQPDEVDYLRSASQLAAYRGQFDKSREVLKTLIDKGRATPEDLNLYAWYALSLPQPIDQEALDAAGRANDLTKNANFNILHTQACVYAEAGKTSHARELLLKAMEADSMEEPNPAVLFGFGLIAEQYGELEAAAKLYSREPKPKTDTPGSTYTLAQKHLAALHSKGSETTKTAKR